MADYSALSSRAIIGKFYVALETAMSAGWAQKVGMLFTSDQDSETYKWLGASPMLREWIGGRQAKSLQTQGVTITNKPFEATMEVAVKDLRRDKTGQINIRIADLARRVEEHWDKLLTSLIETGESAVCYDGQYFFDTDHSEGSSGTQTNDLSTSDYSEIGAVSTATNPTANELCDVILKMIQHMYTFKDDQGEPMNGGAKSFLLQVPVAFYGAAFQAVSLNNLNTGSGVRDNPLVKFNIEVSPNPRSTWTTKLALYRTDAPAKPFILQEEEPVTVQAIAEGSELEFNTDTHHYGVKCTRNVGFGFWQYAVLATLS